MSSHPACEIVCDWPGCGVARVDYGTAAQVRRRAQRSDGFRSIRRAGVVVDLCVDHAGHSDAEVLAAIKQDLDRGQGRTLLMATEDAARLTDHRHGAQPGTDAANDTGLKP